MSQVPESASTKRAAETDLGAAERQQQHRKLDTHGLQLEDGLRVLICGRVWGRRNRGRLVETCAQVQAVFEGCCQHCPIKPGIFTASPDDPLIHVAHCKITAGPNNFVQDFVCEIITGVNSLEFVITPTGDHILSAVKLQCFQKSSITLASVMQTMLDSFADQAKRELVVRERDMGSHYWCEPGYERNWSEDSDVEAYEISTPTV